MQLWSAYAATVACANSVLSMPERQPAIIVRWAPTCCFSSAVHGQSHRVVQDAARQLGHASPFTPAGDMIPDLADLEEQFGAPRGPASQWGSCLRIVAPSGAALSTASVLHLGNNEAALCMCLVTFSTLGGGAAVLAVGTAKGLSFYPRQAEGACGTSVTVRACVSVLNINARRNCKHLSWAHPQGAQHIALHITGPCTSKATQYACRRLHSDLPLCTRWPQPAARARHTPWARHT